MTAIIIDDETEAIKTLSLDLSGVDIPVEIIGSAQSVRDGVELLQSVSADVLFLDIQLGDGLGFDILRELDDLSGTYIVFTTAYNEHVLQALKAGAFDYLLKPLDPDDLEETLGRIEKKIAANQSPAGIDQLINLTKALTKKPRIALNTVDGIYLKDVSSIIYIQSDSNYCRVYFADKTKPMLLSKTLKEFEKSLQSQGFIRTHFSYLINPEHLLSYHSRDGGYVIMSNNEVIPVSSRKRANLLEYLKDKSNFPR